MSADATFELSSPYGVMNIRREGGESPTAHVRNGTKGHYRRDGKMVFEGFLTHPTTVPSHWLKPVAEEAARCLVIKTMLHHEANADGKYRANHCCGCWNIYHDDDRHWPLYAKCNECGEERDLLNPNKSKLSELPRHTIPVTKKTATS